MTTEIEDMLTLALRNLAAAVRYTTAQADAMRTMVARARYEFDALTARAGAPGGETNDAPVPGASPDTEGGLGPIVAPEWREDGQGFRAPSQAPASAHIAPIGSTGGIGVTVPHTAPAPAASPAPTPPPDAALGALLDALVERASTYVATGRAQDREVYDAARAAVEAHVREARERADAEASVLIDGFCRQRDEARAERDREAEECRTYALSCQEWSKRTTSAEAALSSAKAEVERLRALNPAGISATALAGVADTLQAEVEALRGAEALMQQQYDKARAEVERLTVERDEATALANTNGAEADEARIAASEAREALRRLEELTRPFGPMADQAVNRFMSDALAGSSAPAPAPEEKP